jgi:hypothetical protein
VNTDHSDDFWPHPQFYENQRNYPRRELLCYAGQHIAWSWDGSRVLAADPDRRTLDQKLRAAGIDPSRVVHDFVPDPDVSYL